MIKSEIVYTYICDNCGCNLFDNEDSIGITDISLLMNIADDSNWNTDNSKHYCPDCYSFDDNGNLIVLSKFCNNSESSIV